MIGHLLLSVVCATADDILTLEDALRIARESAFTVQIRQAQADQAASQVTTAKSALGPRVDVSANYTRIDGASDFGGGSSTTDSKQASITLAQVIDISGLIGKSVRVAALNKRAAEELVKVETNELDRTVRSTYFDVLLAESLLGVQQDALKAANERWEKAKVRKAEGQIPEFDVLRFNNEVRKTEQQVVEAKGQIQLAKQRLNNAMARPIETPFETASPSELPLRDWDVSALVQLAVKHRPEVASAQYRLDAAQIAAQVAKSGLAPNLQLSASHTRVLDPPTGGSDHGTTASAVVSFPLYDSKKTNAAVATALRTRDQAKISFDQTLLLVALEVRAALTSFGTAYEAYGLALDSQSLATESLRLATLRYDEGSGILIDVTQAQADLTAARAGVESAKYQIFKAYADLQRAAGTSELDAAE